MSHIEHKEEPEPEPELTPSNTETSSETEEVKLLAPKKVGSVIIVKNVEEVRTRTSPAEAEELISKALSDWRKKKVASSPTPPTRQSSSPNRSPKVRALRTSSSKRKRKSAREPTSPRVFDQAEKLVRLKSDSDTNLIQTEQSETKSIKFSSDGINASSETENEPKKKGSRIKLPSPVKGSEPKEENNDSSIQTSPENDTNLRQKKRQLNPYQRLSQKFNRKSIINDKKEKSPAKKLPRGALQRQDSEVSLYIFN